MTCTMTLQWAFQPCAWKNTSELSSPGRLIWAISYSNVLALARIHKHSPNRLLRSGTKAKTRGESSANFVNAKDEQVASMWLSVYLVCKLGLCVLELHIMQHKFKVACMIIMYLYSWKSFAHTPLRMRGGPSMSHGTRCWPQVSDLHTATTLQSNHLRLWRLVVLGRHPPTVRHYLCVLVIKFNYAIGAAESDGFAGA